MATGPMGKSGPMKPAAGLKGGVVKAPKAKKSGTVAVGVKGVKPKASSK